MTPLRLQRFYVLKNYCWGLQSPGCWIKLYFDVLNQLFSLVELWNIMLISSTFSVRSYWGQPILIFWKLEVFKKEGIWEGRYLGKEVFTKRRYLRMEVCKKGGIYELRNLRTEVFNGWVSVSENHTPTLNMGKNTCFAI